MLRPWLHLATLRSDCRIFQDLDVERILDLLLEPYGFPIEKRLSQRYPVRDYQTQFNESDFAFFSRLCEEWGINYHFAHERGAHRLVPCDHMGAHARFASPACAEVGVRPQVVVIAGGVAAARQAVFGHEAVQVLGIELRARRVVFDLLSLIHI